LSRLGGMKPSWPSGLVDCMSSLDCWSPESMED